MTTTETNHSELQAKAQLESIREMVAAMNAAGDDDEAREKAETTIQEDPLSVEVRSDWYTLDAREGDDRRKPAEFCILLCTGGPACRLIGTLNEYGEPEHCRIEHQDWGTPWTEYRISGEDEEALLTYARCFCFGQ